MFSVHDRYLVRAVTHAGQFDNRLFDVREWVKDEGKIYADD